MTDSDLLREILNEAYIETLTTWCDGTNAARLTEPNQDNSFVIIKGLPEDAVIIKTDKFPSHNYQPDHNYFFNDTNGMRRRSDYLIISESKKQALFIEIKAIRKNRKRVEGSEVVDQLKGATCLYEYCKHIAEAFWSENNFLGGYSCRYALIFIYGINKAPSTPKQANDNSTPEKMLIINKVNQETIEYNKIIGTKKVK